MTISVIIPIYNAEKTLLRAVSSILDQTVPPHEIICCLNQCTDGSKDILLELAKQNGSIKIIEQNLFKGIVPTLNKCLSELAESCTLVARMDADDLSYSKRFEYQLDFLNKNPDIDILGSQMFLVKPDTYVTICETNNPLNDNDIKNSLLATTNPIAHPSVMFKRHILLRVGGYDDSIPLCEDMNLWLRASKWFNFANLPDILVEYTSTNNPNYTPVAPQLASHVQKLVLHHFPK